jgi:tRNA-splicing ligase RtcB
MRDERALRGALMADHHKGYSMPIGGVVAYDGAISPSGVGYDIGCGNMAVQTDLTIYDLGVLDTSGAQGEMQVDPDVLVRIMTEIQKQVAFGLGRSNPEPVDHALFDNPVWLWLESVKPGLKQRARQQLGTVGSGNHYVDVLVDERGWIWIANHFGSRGLGHTIASGFFALNAGLNFDDRVPEGEAAVIFDTDTDTGSHYIAAMQLAGEYAYAGREFVTKQVLDILGAEARATVHNHHNYAWYENGEWVVRKGATPLTFEPAFIGGSMGDISVIVRGAVASMQPSYNETLVADIGNIGSAPHGAGRVMSRNKAAGKMKYVRDPETNKKVKYRDTSTALIDWEAEKAKLRARGIIVLGAGADESPGVYKDLGDVLAAHANIEIVHSLTPLGVVMAGDDILDPFKD